MTDTETQREYRNPNVKSIEHLKHIEKNRYGRYAHTPDQPPPNGICKSSIFINLYFCIVSLDFSAHIQCQNVSGSRSALSFT